MKTLLLFLFASCLSIMCFAQQTINGTITHNSLQRSYILYVPASYSAGTLTPLVLNFHGYTSNANDQMIYGDFRAIADTAGFLLVHPMGTIDGSGNTYWNSNWGGSVDDIGFIEALIDSLALSYNINMGRVYSTGMSNGGFMSYTLACDLSNRIAAIASVTGTMNLNQPLTCNSLHPTPVMEIHGTLDPTVPYNGVAGSMEPIVNVLSYWVNFNQCDTGAIVTNVSDINVFDGSTAEHYLYQNGNSGVEVEHYKIINGAHTWPGAPFVLGTTNYDINASLKIWEFFAKYDINGKITGVNQLNEKKVEVIFYPNPTNSIINIKFNEPIDFSNTVFRLFDLTGREVLSRKVGSSSTQIDVSKYPKGGTYTYQLINSSQTYTGKLVIQ